MSAVNEVCAGFYTYQLLTEPVNPDISFCFNFGANDAFYVAEVSSDGKARIGTFSGNFQLEKFNSCHISINIL